MYAVSVIYLNGVRTVTIFKEDTQAWQHARAIAEGYKGCRVFFGTEVIAQSSEAEEDSDE
jgi:hypothetical protein